MKACQEDDTKAGVRAQAMLALTWQLGPRVHESASLTLKDITSAEGKAPAYFVRIIGKGNKQRPVSLKLQGNAALHLRDWLNVRSAVPGSVFCRLSPRGDHPLHLTQHMTPRALHMILASRLEEVRATDAKNGRAEMPSTTWHDFRRTILSDAIAHAGLTTAQHLAGHSSSATTARYDRLWRKNV